MIMWNCCAFKMIQRHGSNIQIIQQTSVTTIVILTTWLRHMMYSQCTLARMQLSWSGCDDAWCISFTLGDRSFLFIFSSAEWVLLVEEFLFFSCAFFFLIFNLCWLLTLNNDFISRFTLGNISSIIIIIKANDIALAT